MANNYTTVSKKGIEYLCSLINQLANVSEGIDDLNLRTDGTFSSVKIDTLLNTLKTDCNEYTDRLVANLSRLELKIATSESEITQPNTMYLYKPSGSTSYEQYVVIEGTKVLLGTTDINMGDYYTITQADAKFVLKTDFDSLKTKVDGKVDKTDIVDNLTSTDTDKPLSANHGKVLKDEVDLKANDSDVVKKTDIVTTIDSASTDDKTPSAKAVYDNMKNKNTIQPSGTISNYSTVFDWAVNNVGASCGYEGNMFDDCPLNNTWGTLICIGTKVESGLKVLFCTNFNKEIYIRTIQRRNGVNAWVTSWQRVCSTTVEDKSPAEISSFVDTDVSGTVNYRVKNGICFVKLWAVQSTTTGMGKFLLNNSSLPIPSCFDTGNALFEANGDGTTTAFAFVDANGALIVHFYKANSEAYGSFSYPVAES